MGQAAQIFGPAQAAVAKAVADAVEEGVIDKKDVEDLVVIASVFIHPEAKDYNRIYRYNYGATKLALKRAMEGFPSVETVMKEKDRAAHGIMGFKVTRLWDAPYLQVALDNPNIAAIRSIVARSQERPRDTGSRYTAHKTLRCGCHFPAALGQA